MSSYKGLFTYDIDNHRYLPVEQADGIIGDTKYRPEPKGMKDVYVSCFCKNGVMIEFETEEEAEKAVKKLKAWERLRDKGFRFVGRSIKDLTITYSFDNYDEPYITQMNKDLDLLFGGEE